MKVDEPYGPALRDYFHLKIPVPAVARSLQKSRFAVSRISSDERDRSPGTPTPNGDAFVLSLQRKEMMATELELAGRSVSVVPFPRGMMSLLSLALDPTPYPGGTFDCCNVYLRRDTFDRVADNLGANRIDDLAIQPGVAINDPIVASLGPCLQPAIEQPEQVNTLFVDHVIMALHAHLAQRYGGMRMRRTSCRGGLASWQLRLARDAIDAHLNGGMSLAQIASDCGLSVSHFARAFTCSTGIPPHRWQMQRRVDRAKDLMRGTSTALVDVAAACGFSDQSHFIRVFSQVTGMTPGQWRRVETE